MTIIEEIAIRRERDDVITKTMAFSDKTDGSPVPPFIRGVYVLAELERRGYTIVKK